MPIYEFRCLGCGREVELLVKGFSSTPDAACAHCGARRYEKLMSRVAFSTGKAESAAPTRKAGCARHSCAGCGGRCH